MRIATFLHACLCLIAHQHSSLLPAWGIGIMTPQSRVIASAAGGLIFGWNALALMLKAQGNYNRNCTQPIQGAPLSPFRQVMHAHACVSCSIYSASKQPQYLPCMHDADSAACT